MVQFVSFRDLAHVWRGFCLIEYCIFKMIKLNHYDDLLYIDRRCCPFELDCE